VNEQASKKLASKMMGRWPSGAPIIKYHDADPADVHPELDPNTYINDNDFMYNYNTDINNNDKHGMLCPFGSHTRRTNPRDSFEENTVKESLILSNRHRIIRRARSYGVPHIASPANFTPQGEVGLLFACFNADISRQFEFIQYTWANYPKFKQLVNDPDPFIGVKEKPDAGLEQVFTIPGKPVNTYVTGLQRFVTVKGGAYFFYPAIHVIKYLTTI
jgi:deferrochelatase/peroxidase EfeB